MAAVATAPDATGTLTAEQAREENAYTLGVQAYLWGFPLYFYGSVIPETQKVGGAGLNAFRKYTALKTAKDRFIVTPNNVTIDAYANIDVSREPVVIHVPPLVDDRWYLVQIGDLFDEIVHNVGGIKGPAPGAYVITGPDFQGPTPGDMIRVSMRTRIGVAAVRIFANGEADIAAAVEAQKGFHMMPLSAYLREGLTYQAPPLVPMPPFESDAPEEIRVFDLLGQAMQWSLPVSADTDDALVAALHQIGLSAGNGFQWQGLDAATRRGLARAAVTGDRLVDARWQALGETTNGWRYNMAGGRSGHDFALRAALAKYMLGGQLAEQVVYPNCRVDDRSEPLNGSRTYVLRFERGQHPQVTQFWNLAMYAPDMLFTENEIDRCSLGSTTDGLKTADDGSITLYLQHARPSEDKAPNWLPAPEGSFNVTMRFYDPLPSVLDGSYRLPAVQRVE